MDNHHYDLIVIGSGPAGEKGAAQAAYFGKKVALVEKSDKMGGTLANYAVPGKGLRETSLLINTFNNRRPKSLNLSLHQDPSVEEILEDSEAIRARLTGWVHDNLDRHKIDIHHGVGAFVDNHTVRVTNEKNIKELTAEIILIATGSRASCPSIFPIDRKNVFHSDNIFSMQEIPSSIIIVGGGTIGCEYACIFNRLGVAVTLVHAADRLFPFADEDITNILLESMEARGIKIVLDSSVVSAESDNNRCLVTLADETVLKSDALLVAVGRRSNVDALRLDNTSVDVDDKHLVKVDNHYRTAAPNIYAAGDVVGFPALASTSMEQGRAAICHAFDFSYKKGIASILPIGIWTIPELSMIGETEQTLSQKKIPYVVGCSRYIDNARGMAIGDQVGLLKLLFSSSDRKLLGVHIIGETACELIAPGMIAMTSGATCQTFIDTCFNFPSLSEMYKYATYDALGKLNQ